MASTDNEILKATELSISLLKGYNLGLIGENQFKAQNEAIENRINEMLKRKEEIKNTLLALPGKMDQNAVNSYIDSMFDLKNWSNEKLRKGISKIWVDANNKIRIEFKYGNTALT